MLREKIVSRPRASVRPLARTTRRTPALPTSERADADAVAAEPRSDASPALQRGIARTRYLRSDSLSDSQRTELIDDLYEIYCETVCGDSREVFEQLVFAAGDVRLALFYGEQGELAGYSYVATEHIEHAGRMHAVMCAGVFIRLGYHGGLTSGLFGLRSSLQYKLRHPRTPLAYLTRSTTPAVYHLLASNAWRAYPHPDRETPEHVIAMLPEISARRGYIPTHGNPWVVREDTSLRTPGRLRRVNDDHLTRFYLDANPRFSAGESLLTWLSLDFTDIAMSLVRVVRARRFR